MLVSVMSSLPSSAARTARTAPTGSRGNRHRQPRPARQLGTGRVTPRQSHLAIDQGPIVVMIENYRSACLWRLFMSCPEVLAGLDRLGFSTPYAATPLVA